MSPRKRKARPPTSFASSAKYEDYFEQLIFQGMFSVKKDGTVLKLSRRGPKGNIEVFPKPREIRSKDRKGNRYVEVCIDGVQRRVPVARIIWRHFRGKIPDEMRVFRKDGDRSNNKLTNLFLDR